MSETRHASAGEAPEGGCFVKTRRVIIGCVLALIPLAMLTAKPYIQQFSPPPPGEYSIEQLWKVTLNNPDSQPYAVWLEGIITEASRGQVFWAKTDSFPLLHGTRILRYADIRSIGIKEWTYAQGYKEFAIRTGGLPAGDYTFTIKLMPDYDTKSVHFVVRPMGPPRLITPREGDTVRTRYPQFVWTPPSPAPTGRVTYELKLFEVLSGQIPEEALRANPPWFTKTGILTTSLKYPPSARPLEKYRSYAWQVTATAPDSVTSTSEVGFFGRIGSRT
jgi:hypothetical protein